MRGDGGSASLWVLATSALVLLIAVALQARALAVLARHRVETAADLAALAAAQQLGTSGVPCAAASRVAAAGGARLTSCSVAYAADGRSGIVRVQVAATVRLLFAGIETVAASARAGRGPPTTATAASGGWARLSDVRQHQVEQAYRAGLVQRFVAVAALRRLHA